MAAIVRRGARRARSTSSRARTVARPSVIPPTLDQLEAPERELAHLVGLLEAPQQELVDRHRRRSYAARRVADRRRGHRRGEGPDRERDEAVASPAALPRRGRRRRRRRRRRTPGRRRGRPRRSPSARPASRPACRAARRSSRRPASCCAPRARVQSGARVIAAIAAAVEPRLASPRDAGQHLAVGADHVAERVDDRERGDPVARARSAAAA